MHFMFSSKKQPRGRIKISKSTNLHLPRKYNILTFLKIYILEKKYINSQCENNTTFSVHFRRQTRKRVMKIPQGSNPTCTGGTFRPGFSEKFRSPI